MIVKTAVESKDSSLFDLGSGHGTGDEPLSAPHSPLSSKDSIFDFPAEIINADNNNNNRTTPPSSSPTRRNNNNNNTVRDNFRPFPVSRPARRLEMLRREDPLFLSSASFKRRNMDHVGAPPPRIHQYTTTTTTITRNNNLTDALHSLKQDLVRTQQLRQQQQDDDDGDDDDDHYYNNYDGSDKKTEIFIDSLLKEHNLGRHVGEPRICEPTTTTMRLLVLVLVLLLLLLLLAVCIRPTRCGAKMPRNARKRGFVSKLKSRVFRPCDNSSSNNNNNNNNRRIMIMIMMIQWIRFGN